MKTPVNPPILAIIIVNNIIRINWVLVISLPGVSSGSGLKIEHLMNRKINMTTAKIDNPAKKLMSTKTSL